LQSNVSSKWGEERSSSIFSSKADEDKLSALSKWTDKDSDNGEVSNHSDWTAISDSEKTPTNRQEKKI